MGEAIISNISTKGRIDGRLLFEGIPAISSLRKHENERLIAG